MQTLTHSKLIAKLVCHAGNAFVSFITFTDPKLKKSGYVDNDPVPIKIQNDLGPIFKRSEFVAMVGANYEKAVNREGFREGNRDAGEFVSEPLKWGKFRDGTNGKIIDHDGSAYVRMTFTPNMKPAIVSYRDAVGNEVPFASVKPFLQAKGFSQTQDDFGNHREITVRTFKIESIVSITFGGESFRIIGDDTDRPMPYGC